MVTKFYSFWSRITNSFGNDNIAKMDNLIELNRADRMINNKSCEELANELNTVLGNNKLISLTSSATNGIVVTTIAYEEKIDLDKELPHIIPEYDIKKRSKALNKELDKIEI